MRVYQYLARVLVLTYSVLFKHFSITVVNLLLLSAYTAYSHASPGVHMALVHMFSHISTN